MGDTGDLIIFGVVAAILVIVPAAMVLSVARVLRNGSRRRRVDECHAWALAHDLDYRPRDDSVLELSNEEPFGSGRSGRAVDVFRGMYDAMPIVFFQYDYTTTTGDRTDHRKDHVVAIRLPAARPTLDVGHEGAVSRRFADDIDFENQRFNDVFRITSPSRRFAFDVIHARTMEWMLADQRARTYRWRFEGPWLMTVRPGALKLDLVPFHANFLIDVYVQVPRHVWSNLWRYP